MLTKVLGPHRFDTVSPWGAISGLSVVIGLGILSIVVAVIIVALGTLVMPGWSATLQSCILTAPEPIGGDCGTLMLALSGFWGIVLAGGFYVLSHARSGGSPQSILLLNRTGLAWWQYVVILVAMIATLYLLELAISFATGATQADLERGLDHLKAIVENGGAVQWGLLLFVVVVVAPVSEEFVFRGFMFTTLVKTRLKFLGAAMVTSATWTALHYAYTWQILVVLFVFGILLAFVVWRTGSVWTGVIVHGLNNLISSIVLVLR